MKIPLFVVLFFSLGKASLSHDEKSKSCKTKKTEVTVTPTSLEEIINFFNFHEDLPQIIKETVAIQTQIIKESLLKPFAHDEDQDLNVTELITKYGYTPEVHEVTTNDGYQLTMHRIVGDGPVVFMMNGALCSSDDWVTARPENSLAFMLATAGYDVWMGNPRGNKHSTKHVSFSPDCDEFWKFGLDEISLIDVPSMIDYALNSTGKSSLSYVGFSQGTTNLVALCSDMPEYNEKISVAVLLAPSVYLSHWKSPLLRLIALNPEAIYKFAQLIGLENQTNKVGGLVTGLLCGNNPLSEFFCSNVLSLVFGYGRGQLDIPRLPVILRHFPAGASIRQLIHYGQVGRTGSLQKFDFTKERNLEVYGSEEPPEYKPQKVTVPVVTFYGEYDWLVNVTDVNQLLGELPNVVNATFLKNHAHLDHIWGKNTKKLINKPVVELIGKYQN